jgi:uncharacterized tellurite resistance protein B-like protein
MKQSIQLDDKQLEALCDLLMAAAHSDGEFDGLEAGEISDVLSEIIAADLPAVLSTRLSRFVAAEFVLADAVAPMMTLAKPDKLAVLGLVTRIIEADDVHDLAEADFLKAVAVALDCSVADVSAQTFSVEIISPPPLPKS